MSENNPFLIVGLGNPGPDYHHNRHNVGFMAIDALACTLDISIARVERNALVGKGLLDDQRVILAKPQTFMNKSGQAVASLARFYKIPVDQILVVYDDLDLPFGSLRLRPGGGTGGHKGMDSIMNRLGTREFPRLRVGIGRPPGRMDPADFVLHDFDPPQQELLPQVLDRAVQAMRTFVLEGVEPAMTMFNERPNKDADPGEDQD
ncbi:MAG TPA: aminoacyl-tRNA hydrolase [Brevefilum fermentans]|jgi:PTH1 family peptidyl-tRNA hydrolase|nr:aminoacyl-tRNA hydrolase [Brevefilum fermentans]